MPKEYSKDILGKACKIKLLVLDVDGVFTNGELVYGLKGEAIKRFNVNDGLGISFLRKSGVRCVLVTAKASGIVLKRAKDLGIDKVYQNFHDKIKAFQKIQKVFKVKEEEICCMGDDIIDVPMLKRAGLAVCPPNAVKDVQELVHFITENKGGSGAVREVTDLIMRSQGTWDEVVGEYWK